MSSYHSHFALLFGSAFIAFSPILSLFFLIIYHKAQLVIIVTSAAFFFLLSSLCASIVWYFFYILHLDGIVSILIPGILSQFLFRCAFVGLYHKVEKVIRISIEQQEEQEGSNNNNNNNTTSRTSNNTNNNSVNDEDNNNNNNDDTEWTNIAKLRLQLNDAACGIAAGVGFGGMHTIMFYGSLLASETDNAGVLYQESCPTVPSLVQSAIYAFSFAVMDIFWMLLTFFGMRRRLLYHRNCQFEDNQRIFGSYFGNSRNGGNLALMFVLVAHLFSSLITTATSFGHGCVVSLPLIIVAMLVTMYTFWAGAARIYMPPENSNDSISRVASRTGGNVGGDNSNVSRGRLRHD